MQEKYTQYISGTCALDMTKQGAHQRYRRTHDVSGASENISDFVPAKASAKLITVNFKQINNNESRITSTRPSVKPRLKQEKLLESALHCIKRLSKVIQEDLDYRHKSMAEHNIAAKEIAYLMAVGSVISYLFVLLEINF